MRWTDDKLRTKFPATVREERRAEGLDPDVRPTQEWLREHGYSGIEGFARRNNLSVTEVLEEICGFDPPTAKSLDIDHPETRRLVNEWLEAEQKLFNQWGDSRVQDARTHFRTLADVAYEELGSTNLLRLVRTAPPTDVDLIMRLFSGLSNRMETQGAQSNYTRSLERWADYLSLRDEIEDHKVGEVREMMGYTYERRSPEHKLKPKQIRDCWRETERLEEQALVVILTAAGTRRAEPTNIETSQLRLDRHDPYIVFDDDRKTGAATVPIMAGVQVIEAWLDHLEDTDYWDGKWLFPSTQSRDGSRPAGWVNDTIGDLVERAGITFPDGKEPTPKHFRSFWYNHYITARQEWLAHVEMLAEEQGVSSSKIIDLHYLTAKAERDHFRKFAQSYFAAVFGQELVHGIEGVMETREEERDEVVQKALDDYTEMVRTELQADSSDEEAQTHESPAVTDPVSAWGQARLRVEHASAAAADELEHYPPSPKRATAILAGLGLWAVIAGTYWGISGVFIIDPLSGDVTASPSVVIGLVLGFALIVLELPDLDRVTPERTPTGNES